MIRILSSMIQVCRSPKVPYWFWKEVICTLLKAKIRLKALVCTLLFAGEQAQRCIKGVNNVSSYQFGNSGLPDSRITVDNPFRVISCLFF